MLVGGSPWVARWPNRPLTVHELSIVLGEMSPADSATPTSVGWEWIELLGDREDGLGVRNLVLGRCSSDRFICRLWDDLEGELIVTDASESDDPIPFFLGDYGQTIRSWTTSLDNCLIAARGFWSDGAAVAELSWRPVGP